MRFAFFETYRPHCPLCRDERQGISAALRMGHVERADGDEVLEGILVCSNTDCQCEYPIIDGIPVILPNIRSFVAEHIQHLCRRSDLSASLESLLGDCCGPASGFDVTRQQLSCYAWNHYADRSVPPVDISLPGSTTALLETALEVIPKPIDGPLLDLGCGTGRISFELANRSDQLVLGIDLNFPMLQLAARAMRTGRGSYPLRRVGVVYDRQEFELPCEDPRRVDFWICDAAALPLPRGACGLVTCLNVLDSTPNPIGMLQQVQQVLKPGGSMILASPYDWSSAVTPIEGWIGGHSQRASVAGDSAALLRRLLTSDARFAHLEPVDILGEWSRVPWLTRLHDRSTVHYDVHLIAARNRSHAH